MSFNDEPYADNLFTPKPMPRNPQEASRWGETALRRRLLDGLWEGDLIQHRRAHFDGIRDNALGPCDMSSNAFKRISEELSVLYTEAPRVMHPDDNATLLIRRDGLLERSGLWAQMQRFQRWVIGCREYLIRPHIQADGVPYYRPVSPDMVLAIPDSDRPDYPIKICELRERIINHKVTWTWDVLDVSNAEYPVYEVRLYNAAGKTEIGEDITEMVMGQNLSGENYPYRDSKGYPVLPYVLYHASSTSKLWDPYYNLEIVRGSLTCSVLWTFWVHCVRDASWPQRYGVGIGLPGGIAVESNLGPRVAAPADPASLIAFEAIGEQQPMVGQFNAGSDPKELGEAISEFELRLAEYAGLPASDIQRVRGAARSGYSIALSQEGRREAQKQYRPQFETGDRQLINLTAIMLNRATGSSYPEGGYSIAYQSIPQSKSEAEAQRASLDYQLKNGLIGPIDIYQALHPESTIEQALSAMREARAQASMIEVGISRADYSNTGRPSAAGVVATLTQQVAEGLLTREAAINQLVNIMGFSRPQAEVMI